MVHSTPAMKIVAVVSRRRKACPVSMMEFSRRLAAHYQLPDYLSTDDRMNPSPRRWLRASTQAKERWNGPGARPSPPSPSRHQLPGVAAFHARPGAVPALPGVPDITIPRQRDARRDGAHRPPGRNLDHGDRARAHDPEGPGRRSPDRPDHHGDPP